MGTTVDSVLFFATELFAIVQMQICSLRVLLASKSPDANHQHVVEIVPRVNCKMERTQKIDSGVVPSADPHCAYHVRGKKTPVDVLLLSPTVSQ